ncbi:MAG: AmpG family muropeptide MFS transporter [Steroidobacteraceae bacterium]
MTAAQASPVERRGWGQALRVYGQRPVLSMLFLGFSAGLPFYLVFQTLSAWLRQEGIERATIGMLAWVGLTYSIKFLWSPIVDRFRIPFLFRWLGRRRSWMLIAQLGIAAGIANLASSDPSSGVLQIAIGALFLAFCSATQDISIDAWRIESVSVDLQGAMAAAYQIGYRAALITGGAGALGLAQGYDWPTSYLVMAALAGVGVATTLLVREPKPAVSRESEAQEARVVEWLERKAHWPDSLRAFGGHFIGAVVCPLTDFFARYGLRVAVIVLLLIGSYRLTEFTMGSMANPFYIDHGYTLGEIATIVKAIGLPVSMLGVVVGGVIIAKFGLRLALFLGSGLIIASNLGFALLATTESATLVGLALANSVDNLAQGVHGTALIAFLSSLTSSRYTATQYALFSSFYALPGKLLEGTSGFVVDAIGYSAFFTYTAALSIPGLLILLWLARRRLVNARGTVATRGQGGAADAG